MNAQVNNAVQNTLKSGEKPDTLNGQTLGQVVSNLDKTDLKAAYASINEAYDIQWGADGIQDTQEKLHGLQGKVGEKVYAIAKVAMKHCEGKLVIARSYFLALCLQAETMKQNWYVDKYKEQKPIGELIPLWAQYKSSIAKGMEKGVDPNELIAETDAPKFATAAQYRAEVQRLEKEAKGGNARAGNERNTSEKTATQLQLVTKGWSPELSAAMEVMCKELNRLNHEEQNKFAPAILALGADIAMFANSAERATKAPRTGKIQESETGEVLGTESSEELDPGTKAALQKALDEEKPAEAATPKAERRQGGRKAREA